MKNIAIAVILTMAMITGVCFSETVSMKADKPSAMTIEVKPGKKIISHPSGVVVEYTKEDVEKQYQELLKQRAALDEQIRAVAGEAEEMK
jgi:hypothetical protein